MRCKLLWTGVFFVLFLTGVEPALALQREDNVRTDTLGFISGEGEAIPVSFSFLEDASAENIARLFLFEYGPEMGISSQESELILSRISGPQHSEGLVGTRTIKFGVFYPESADGQRTHVVFQQVYEGVPVFAGEARVHLLGQDILAATADIEPAVAVDTEPTLSAEQAQQRANDIWERRGLTVGFVAKPEIYILNPARVGSFPDRNFLVWMVRLADSVEFTTEGEALFIDAHSGDLRLVLPEVLEARDRAIYDCNNSFNCHLARAEGEGSAGIAEVDFAYDYAGDAYDYYSNNFGRDSFDDNGLQIKVYTRQSPIYCAVPTAFWNNIFNYMGLCDGMARQDVVVHEYTHGVNQFTAGLIYTNQAGALNEAMSDIFASNVDLNWTIGENSAAGILRDMSNPPAYGDPDRLFDASNYYCGSNQSKYVHTNSGVLNKGAYLLADGDSFNGCSTSGIGREKLGQLNYQALTNYLGTSSNFKDYYNGMVEACNGLYGAGSVECVEVANALQAVEIDQQPLGSQTSPVCSGGVGQTPACADGGTPPPPTPTPTATPTPTPGGPTVTPSPTPTVGPSPTPSPTPTAGVTITPSPSPTPFATATPPTTAEVAIWNTMLFNGEEVLVKDETKLPEGTEVSVCYNVGVGPYTVAVDNGVGAPETFKGDTSEPIQGGCLFSEDSRFFPLGEKATPEGFPHVYTVTSAGQQSATSILVTTGTTPTPTPSKTVSPTPSITLEPSPMLSPVPTAEAATCWVFTGAYDCSDDYRHGVTNNIAPVGDSAPLVCVPGRWQETNSNCTKSDGFTPWGEVKFQSCENKYYHPGGWQSEWVGCEVVQ